jgi:hypothetical protein
MSKKKLESLGASVKAPMYDEHGKVFAYFCETPLEILKAAAYQRGVSREAVAKLKGRFDYKACQPLSVSLRKGKLWLFDGGHRKETLAEVGYGSHYTITHVGLTYDEEARLFYELNDAPRRMGGWTKYKAAYNAGETVHRRLIEIAGKHRLTTPMSPGVTKVGEADIRSPVYLLWPFGKGGYPLVEETCKVLDMCWRMGSGRRPASLKRDAKETSIIRGLAVFLKKYRLGDNPLPWNTVRMVLKNTGPEGLIEEAKKCPAKRIDQRQYTDALCSLFGVDCDSTRSPNCHLRLVG